MRSVSESYLNYIDSSLLRRPKSKFVVDNIHYSGEQYLVGYPKVEHKTDKAIGSFPAKTCELEILNLDGTLDLHGKEVTVYRGLEIEGTTEWVRIGVFMASDNNIKTNINKRTITFKGTDKTQLLDQPYGGASQWEKSKRIYDIVQEICTRNGIELAAATFPMRTYTFPDVPPGLDFNNITDRQMIAYIAELGGCIAMFTHNGKLAFKKGTDTGVTIKKSKYKNLSVENSVGPINAVAFGHRDYEDALLYMQEGVTDETKVEWTINDNPLTTTTDKNNLIQLVSEHFFGRSFVPFEISELIDDYIFDLNDTVTVEKKDGSKVQVTVLEMSTSSRIKSNFGAATQTPGKTKTALAGSIYERVGKVEFIVDHQQKSISALIEDAEGMQTAIEANEKGISAQAKANETLIQKYNELSEDFLNLDIAGTVTTEVQKEATVQLLADAVEAKVSANYVSKADLNDYVKTSDLSTSIKATEELISAEAKRITTIEKAGYITTEAAQALIDASADNITLSVQAGIKTVNPNILLDSACFDTFEPLGFATSGVIPAKANKNAQLPSGRQKVIYLAPAADVSSYKHIGVRYNNAQILGEGIDAGGNITKIKAGQEYTLSFWLKDQSIPDGQTRTLSKTRLINAGSEATIKYIGEPDLSVTKDWKKFVISFSISGTVGPFQLTLAREWDTKSDLLANFAISSFKLEEGTVATSWCAAEQDMDNKKDATVATIEDMETRVEAKLELCVQTDADGNLQSAIHAKANQITIESDNFTLDGDGNMTCKNANITGGTIFTGDDDRNIVIEKGHLKQFFGGQQILDLSIETSALEMTPAGWESSYYSQIKYLNGIRFDDSQGGVVEISRQSWGYGELINTFERDIIKSYGALVVSANDSNNALILAGSGVWLCGKLYFTNYRNVVNDRTPLYVNSSGEITI